MEAHGIVPDSIDAAPPHVAEVQFPSGATMSLGNELTPRQVTDVPSVIRWPLEPGAFYTVLFIDLDIPSREMPVYRNDVYWLVVNVPDTGDIASGDTVHPYISPGAPEGTKLHRHVLLVLKQYDSTEANLIPSGSLNLRLRFNTRKLMNEYKMSLLAGNFYLAQCDDLVRERRAKLVENGFKTYQVVPDVIDQVPKYCAEVVYPTGMILLQGDELTPVAVKDIPKVFAWPAKDGALYTVLFVDPDAPSRADPHLGQFLHWLVVNVKGNDISSGDTIAEFIGSGPPLGTGLHRYIFLIYQQSGTINWTKERISNKSASGRSKFKVRDFVKKHSLGELTAGCLYQAQFDDYCPFLHAQLGFK